MRERVILLGGELDFDSQPGPRTTVAARIPVKRRPTNVRRDDPISQPHRRSA